MAGADTLPLWGLTNDGMWTRGPRLLHAYLPLCAMPPMHTADRNEHTPPSPHIYIHILGKPANGCLRGGEKFDARDTKLPCDDKPNINVICFRGRLHDLFQTRQLPPRDHTGHKPQLGLWIHPS